MNPYDPSAFASITQALAAPPAITAGTVIRIQGLTSGGFPTGYSNAPALPSQLPETFPLVVPDGVSLEAADAAPVYIYSTIGTSALIQVAPGPAASGAATRLQDLVVIGGDVGVELSNAANFTKTVRIEGCKFVQNQIGLSCIESGAGTMDLLIAECTLAPGSPAGLTPPAALQAPGIGFRFHAVEAQVSQIPTVNAELRELQTHVGYAAMSEFPYLGFIAPDLSFRTTGTNGLGDFSRVVEVYASGKSPEHGVGQAAEVNLAVQGGNFQGDIADWMFGIYAAAEDASKHVQEDYTCGYTITITGAEFKKFSTGGIFATSGFNGRGHLQLQGGTLVADVRNPNPRSPGDYLFSGVHGFSYDGYLGVECLNSRIQDNQGHGIYLVGMHANVEAQGEYAAIEHVGEYPLGAYLRLWKCDVHGNGGSGVAVAAGEDQFHPYPLVRPEGPAIAGGTWHESAPGILDLREKAGFELPSGPGLVNRCRISNNGEHGIYAFSYGMSDPPNTPQPYVVSFQVVNSMVWNNPAGGLVAVLSNSTGPSGPNQHGPMLLVPIVHSTFAGNGQAGFENPCIPDPIGSDWSVEVWEDPAWSGNCRYEWHLNPAQPGQPNSYLMTRLFNSIFQRTFPLNAANDFGPQLETVLGIHDPLGSPPNSVADWRIAMAGIRAWTGISLIEQHHAEDGLSAFAGPINLMLRTADQFLLSSYGTSNKFGNVPLWILPLIPAASVDYSGAGRQPPVQNPVLSPDQGADEL